MAVKNIEEYFDSHPKWDRELRLLHDMILSTGLKPAIKWGAPVYTLNGKNVVGLSAFKNHYGIWLFKGALLEKNTSMLVNAQEGKTKAMRQIKLDADHELSVNDILPYVKEAIENGKAGKEIKKVVTKKELIICPEFEKALDEDKELKESFDQLTPGKQREYADHISEAKREATKIKRMEKIIPMIKKGVGLHDKYKNC
ncbi:YdeI/OmpD-associated family protein [Christiangramia aquimixticola]|uniref:YdeI/OmpD-associated family protein n=1 Tax=Christiangramia aquimixticola TaxID=1697558 RepID=UPI003AA969E5